MSSRSKTLLALVIGCFALSGCGFQPVYGEKSVVHGNASSGGVAVDSVHGRMGQQFKADLEDRLNPDGGIPANPVFRLEVTIVSSEGSIGVARDGTVSRYNVYLDSTYRLLRASDGTEVTRGTLRHVSSYNNVTGAYFSTYVSQDDAVKRGITELSEVYAQRLSPFLAGS